MSTELETVSGTDVEGQSFTIEWVDVSKISVDTQVQRWALNEAKVRRILRNFNEDALGMITLSNRGLGEIIALDGQHRTEAVRRRTENKGRMHSKVFIGLTRAQEAKIFLDLNAGNQPSLFDKFRVGVVGEDEEFNEVNRIAHSLGFTIGPDHANGTINAVAGLLRVHRLRYGWETDDERADHSILALALGVINDAWGNQEVGLKATSIEAMGKLIQRYDNMELPRLVETLEATPGGPAGLLGRAKGYAATRGIRQWQAMGQIVVDEYNKYLPAHSPRRLSVFAPR